jgi:hypothetical protein
MMSAIFRPRGHFYALSRGRRHNPSSALRMGRGRYKAASPIGVSIMFNFSANNLILQNRYDCKSCVVFIMQDLHTKRIYRLYDFSKSQPVTPNHIWCVSGKVNSADKIYLVIETVKIDPKNRLAS